MTTTELETLMIKIVGDAELYKKSLKEVEKSTKDASKTVENTWDSNTKAVDALFKAASEKVPKLIDNTVGKASTQVDKFLGNLSEISTTVGSQNNTNTALQFLGETISSIVPMLKMFSGIAIGFLNDLWEKLKMVGSVITGIPKGITFLQESFNTLTGTDIGKYFRDGLASGASVASLALAGLASGFNKVTASVSAAWAATNAFSAKYLTFSALGAGISAAMVMARTATVTMASTAVSTMLKIAATAKATIAGTAATATAATTATAAAGGASGFAAIAGNLLNMGKSAGLWGLAIAGAGIAVYGAFKALVHFNKELKDTEKQIRVNTMLTMMDIEAYKEETQALRDTSDMFFLNEARDVFIKQAVGEADTELKKLRRAVDETEKKVEKVSWWKKLFGTSEAKEAKSGYAEAKDALEKYQKSKYDVGEAWIDPETGDEESRTIQFEIDRYKREVELARTEYDNLSWLKKQFNTPKAQRAKSEVENNSALLAEAEKRKTELEDAPNRARKELNKRIEQTIAGLQRENFLVGKTGADALVAEARLKGVSDWRIQNLRDLEERLKQSKGSLAFKKSWEEMIKSLEKENNLSGLTGIERKIAELNLQGKEFGRSIPEDKLNKIRELANQQEAEAKRTKRMGQAEALTERLKGPAEKLRQELEDLNKLYKEEVGLAPKDYIKALEELKNKLKEAEKATRGAYDTNTRFNSSLVGSAEAISKMEDYKNQSYGNKLGIDNKYLVESPLKENTKDYVDVLKEIRDLLKKEKEANGLFVSPTDLTLNR